MKKLLALVLMGALALSMVACGEKETIETPEADVTTSVEQTVEDTTEETNVEETTETVVLKRSVLNADKTAFENEEANFTVKLLDGWTVATDEELINLYAGQTSKDVLEKGEISSDGSVFILPDLMISAPTSHENLTIAFESLVPTNSMDVSTSDYLEISRKTLEALQDFKVVKEGTETINGNEYAYFMCSYKQLGVALEQTFAVRKVGTNMLVFIFTGLEGDTTTTLFDLLK